MSVNCGVKIAIAARPLMRMRCINGFVSLLLISKTSREEKNTNTISFLSLTSQRKNFPIPSNL